MFYDVYIDGVEFKMGDTSHTIISEITGIDNTFIENKMYDRVVKNGSVIGYSRIQARRIGITFVLVGNDIQLARRQLYQLFSYGKPHTLAINTPHGNYTIDFYTESIQAPIFSEKCTVSVELICPEPYFYYDSVYEPISSLYVKDFTLPFYIPQTGITFGRFIQQGSTEIINPTDVDSFPKFTIYITDIPVIGITLQHTSPTGKVSKIVLSDVYITQNLSGYKKNDIIYITITESTFKIELHRGTDLYDITDALLPTSNMFLINPGKNDLTLYATLGSEFIVCECYYTKRTLTI